MERRMFLKLGMVMGGTIVLGGVHRFGRSLASAAGTAIPTVDQLVMTNVVDNIYDVFAKRGKIGEVTVQRTVPSRLGLCSLSEHGLAYHLASVRGDGTQGDPARLRLDRAESHQQLPGAQSRPDQGRRPDHEPRARRPLWRAPGPGAYPAGRMNPV